MNLFNFVLTLGVLPVKTELSISTISFPRCSTVSSNHPAPAWKNPSLLNVGANGYPSELTGNCALVAVVSTLTNSVPKV